MVTMASSSHNSSNRSLLLKGHRRHSGVSAKSVVLCLSLLFFLLLVVQQQQHDDETTVRNPSAMTTTTPTTSRINSKNEKRYPGLVRRPVSSLNNSSSSSSSSSTISGSTRSKTNAPQQQQAQQQQTSQQEEIPRLLIFTHGTNLLSAEADPKYLRFFDNIVNTIQKYADAWRQQDGLGAKTTKTTTNTNTTNPLLRVWFLNNTECRNVIQDAEPRLVPFFDQEPRGDFQGDICRAAALYVKGGYYHDVDMRTIHAETDLQDASFSSVQSPEGFFNSFIAAAPRNDILGDTLQVMLHYYQYKSDVKDLKQGNYDDDIPPQSAQKKYAASHMPNVPASMQDIQNNPTGLMGPYTLEAAYKYHVIKQQQERQGKGQDEESKTKNPSNPQQQQHDTDQDDEGIEEQDDDQDEQEAQEWHELEYAANQHDSSVQLLLERPFNADSWERQEYFPNMQFQDEGTGCCCNYVVFREHSVRTHSSSSSSWNPFAATKTQQQQQQRKAYFFSRMIGARETCDYPTDQPRPKLPPSDWKERKKLLPQGGIDYVQYYLPSKDNHRHGNGKTKNKAIGSAVSTAS